MKSKLIRKVRDSVDFKKIDLLLALFNSILKYSYTHRSEIYLGFLVAVNINDRGDDLN